MIDEGFPSYETDLQSRGERRVLACLLRKNHAICHCAWLMPRHFSSDLNGMIFAAIRALMARDQRANSESVYTYLRETFPRYHVKPAYFHALEDLDVQVSHIGSYAAKMREAGHHA
ncbi:DnaB-like helicase N-terminal domain-containing protein [Caballeronia zhejiangensis]|uniref:DnaB-like helicase N-terminal domain-containing protein n=1 Tax=Caballeronia zhejiangensis TaxID=871203 RepID=UPI00158E6391|nr:DnaB-like helicase N-terminal domain-containing protein [Caballeronia zhejiangensis]MCG7403042.1 hypothetical protein [Caballeronia zhejiangensis]MCI1043866.1 hypothetical protein [Caballeronia zhejiangensis]